MSQSSRLYTELSLELDEARSPLPFLFFVRLVFSFSALPACWKTRSAKVMSTPPTLFLFTVSALHGRHWRRARPGGLSAYTSRRRDVATPFMPYAAPVHPWPVRRLPHLGHHQASTAPQVSDQRFKARDALLVQG